MRSARKLGVSYSKIKFDCSIQREVDDVASDGVRISGVRVGGAKFDDSKGVFTEARFGDNTAELPTILMLPRGECYGGATQISLLIFGGNGGDFFAGPSENEVADLYFSPAVRMDLKGLSLFLQRGM